MTTITICSSASFYRQAVEIKDQLEKENFTVLVPDVAEKMRQSGDFEVSHYKTWFADANDYHKKAELMRKHFEKIEKGDAVLVLNYEKHGKQNYIGGNVLMEMSLAFYLRKPIFILNDIPKDSPFEEEIRGMGPIVLLGDAKALQSEYAQLT
jgi:hypothetical protein